MAFSHIMLNDLCDLMAEQLSRMIHLMTKRSHYIPFPFLRCRWKGAPCPEGSLTEEITEMGLCYTFNADRTSPFVSEKSGRKYLYSPTETIYPKHANK